MKYLIKITKKFNNFNNIQFLLILLPISLILVFCIFLLGNYAIPNPSVSNNSSFNSNQLPYTITMFDSAVGGDVTNNTAINQYIPKTNLSRQIFNMTHDGSVMLKFGNGEGPKILISVGIHGNEPQANVAGMMFIEYLKDKKFNGMLYIIPFDIPKNTAKNTRYYNGMDPNRIANINGTPSWKIVQFAHENGIEYIIDMHSGANVGPNGLIYINQNATTQEKNMANYIVNRTKCKVLVNNADSPGMVRDTTHSYGIDSITLEVERDTTPVMISARTEFEMLMAAMQYLGFSGTQYYLQVMNTQSLSKSTGVLFITS